MRCELQGVVWRVFLWGFLCIAARAPGFGQDQVPCFQRLRVGEVLVQSPNPFRDVRMSASFRHEPTGEVFRIPVVCVGQSETPASDAPVWRFGVDFLPHRTGEWTYALDPPQLSGGSAMAQSAELRGRFLCVQSEALGFVAPQMARPELLQRRFGDGREEPYFPISTTLFSFANPLHSAEDLTNTFRFLRAVGINRVRFPLTYIQAQKMANDPSGEKGRKVANHTVFRRLGGDYTPRRNGSGSVELEAFDLAQWELIDQRLQSLLEQGLQASIILAFVSNRHDFEDDFLSDRAKGPGFHPIPVPDSPFAHRHELFLWYAVGRLAAYPHVEWCFGHEWNLAERPDTNPRKPRTAYEPGVMRSFGMALAAFDPWMSTASGPLRLALEVGARGSFYGLGGNQLQERVNPFCASEDASWLPAIGLQRGGELGLTSIVRIEPAASSIASLQILPNQPMIRAARPGPYPHWPPGREDLAHRDRLGADPRPIFIEEDWISRNDLAADLEGVPEFQPGIAHSFTQPDNPYARYIGLNPIPLPRGKSSVVGEVLNPNAYPFIKDNFAGLRKFFRDQAWMCGGICQAFPSYWSRKYTNLSEAFASRSGAPFLALRRSFLDHEEWWRFRYDPSVVIAQSRLEPLSGDLPRYRKGLLRYEGELPRRPHFAGLWGETWTERLQDQSTFQALPGRLQIRHRHNKPIAGRLPFEQLVVAASSDHEAPHTQFLIYCPVGLLPNAAPPLNQPATARLNLKRLGPGQGFRYRFLNPDTGWQGPLQSAEVPPNGEVLIDQIPREALAEHGEWALLINPRRP